MNPAVEDDLFLDRLRSKDREAFRDLVTTFTDMVFNLNLRLVRNKELAEDLTQEVFIKVYQALPGFRGKSSLSTWLYRIAYNVAMNELAKARHRYETNSLDDPDRPASDTLTTEDERGGILGEVERSEAIERVNRQIETLKPEQKWAITLYYHGEQSYQEISEIMGIPLGTVKTLLYRAKEALREKLKQENPHRE